VGPFSETNLKPHERLFIPNYHFHRTDRYPGRKGETAVEVGKSIPLNHVDLPPLVSAEVTGVCIPIGNSEVQLASVYKSPGRAWIDAGITELLSFRCKPILAGDLNAKHPFWNTAISNPSREKLTALSDLNEFEISAPHCLTHYFPERNGNVLDIVVHQNITVSDVTVSDILDSGHCQMYSTHGIMSI
jgi:hypothetical protein